MILTSVPTFAAVDPPAVLPPEITARRDVMESTYPGWRIIYLAAQDRWYAGRLPELTPAQVAAGVVATFSCGSYEEFGAALARQAGIVDRVGGFNS